MISVSQGQDYISLFTKYPLLMHSAHIEPHLLYFTLPDTTLYTLYKKALDKMNLKWIKRTKAVTQGMPMAVWNSC